MYILFLLFVGLVSNFVLATGEALVSPPATPRPSTPRRVLSESSHETKTPPRNMETEVRPPNDVHSKRKNTKKYVFTEQDKRIIKALAEEDGQLGDDIVGLVFQSTKGSSISNCRINTLQHSNKRIPLAGQVHPFENNSSPLNQYTNDSVGEDDGAAEESLTEVYGVAEESLTEVFGD